MRNRQKFALAVCALMASLSDIRAAQADDTTNTAADIAPMRSFSFAPLFLRGSGKELTDRRYLPRKQIYAFSLIPGTFIYSHRVKTVQLQTFLKDKDELAVNLDDWSEAIASGLDTLDKFLGEGGVRVTPADTRMGRVVASAFTPGDGRIGSRHLGQYSLLADGAGHRVNLVFFDRPCRVEGVFRDPRDDWSVTADLDIKEPGLYAIVFKHEQGSTRVTLGPSPSSIEIVAVF